MSVKLSDAIRIARKNKGWNQAELAKHLGVGQASISDWERAVSPPSRDNLAKLYELLDMAPEDLDPYYAAGLRPQTGTTDIITAPEYNIRLSAGGGFTLDADTIKEHWTFNRSYLRDVRLETADLMVSEIDGDSMEPKLISGDRAIIDRNDCDYNRPGIFALWDTTALVVKRVEKILDRTDPPMLAISSDNPEFSTYSVPAADVKVIGRVCGAIRRF